MLLFEIGLESEYWLMNDDKIMEAPVYNFPADEMGFLIEVRSAWGSDPEDIVKTLEAGVENERAKAKGLGFELVEKAWMSTSREWQEYIAEKYNHMGFPDNTRNIYSEQDVTQHTGLREGRATAGLHVHFSVWDTEKEKFLWLSEGEIIEIVREMDTAFEDLIVEAERIMGEWQPKGIGDDSGRPHGFEYRPLPATAPKLEVAKAALRILMEKKIPS